MAHTSIPVDSPIELINISPLEISPLISKCQIKVCYVSDKPNRNRSVITEETARKMAPSLRGAAIVGHYEESIKDFEEHNKLVELKNNTAKVIEDTRPYGFVDLNAPVWFQEFLDDDKVVRKYLVTEGYLWTGQYPECQRVIDDGNNQSMELDEYLTHGEWTTLDNTKMEFFIINEAVVSKLCILGEDMEPCFEGANITNSTTQYSFDRGTFANQLLSLMQDIKGILSKGGKPAMFELYNVELGDDMWKSTYAIATGINEKYIVEGVYNNTDDTPDQYFLIASDEENNRVRINFSIAEDGATTYGIQEGFEIPEDYAPVFTREAVSEYLAAQVEATPAANEGNSGESGEPESDNNVGTYKLEEIPEYVEAMQNLETLRQEFAALKESAEAATAELATLREYKNTIERKDKQAMIDSFYMLSDAEKKPVVDKINEYSVEEIEEKLSVICVRNKVSFAKEDEGNTGATTYNLEDGVDNDSTPDWVKAVMETAKTL